MAIIKEKVDFLVEIYHHVTEIQINEITGVSGCTCIGCSRIEVTHPFIEEDGDFDYRKVIPKII